MSTCLYSPPLCEHGKHPTIEQCYHCNHQRQIKNIGNNLLKLERRLDELEDFNQRQIDWNQHISKRLDELEKNELITTKLHICPCCHGKGYI